MSVRLDLTIFCSRAMLVFQLFVIMCFFVELQDCYNMGPPFDSVQLVNITPISMVHCTYNYS